MPTALYRLNGNRVLAISEQNQIWQFDAGFYGMLFDPELPDGANTREITMNEQGLPIFGPENTLGFAKIADPGINTVRNATQPEIDAWDAAEGADELAQDASRARTQLINHPLLARAFKALIRMILANEERANAKYNTLAGQWQSFHAGMISQATITQVRTGMASVTPPEGNLPENYNFGAIIQNLLDDIRDNDAPRRKDRV